MCPLGYVFCVAGTATDWDSFLNHRNISHGLAASTVGLGIKVVLGEKQQSTIYIPKWGAAIKTVAGAVQ